MAARKNLRVALVSMKHIAGDIDFNLSQQKHWLELAMEKEPAFVGFPEFSLTGWVYDSVSMLSLNSSVFKEIESWAAKYRVHIATCFVEKQGERSYNTCLVTGPEGRLGVMRKINLVSSEGKHYTPGQEFPVFDIAGCRMGVTTCADATRYEMMHILSLRGAEVIFAPHANSLPNYGNCRDGWTEWRMTRWPFFAQDACVAIAGVSCAGLFADRREGEEELRYCGGAMVMDWTGKPVKALKGKGKQEGVLVADVDLAKLREARSRHNLFAEFRSAIVYNRKTGWVMGKR